MRWRRIVIRQVPELRIEMAEELPGLRLPRPPEVEDDLAQRFEGLWELRDDVEGMEWLHAGLGWLWCVPVSAWMVWKKRSWGQPGAETSARHSEVKRAHERQRRKSSERVCD